MPQVIRPTQIIREISTHEGEMTVKIELTLNINTNQDGQINIQTEAKPQANLTPGVKQTQIPDTNFFIPEFESGEMMNFGKEVQ
jgi:hypothetical protein